MATLCKVVEVVVPGSIGAVGVTGVGFEPTAIIVLGTGSTLNTTAANCNLQLGAAVSSTSRFALNVNSTDAGASSVTRRVHADDRCYLKADNNGDTQTAFDLDSLDADGFTLDWLAVADEGDTVFVMCLGGDINQAAIIAFDSPTSTGTEGYTGAGFQPECVIIGSIGLDTAPGNSATQMNFGWGFAISSTARGALGLFSNSAQADAITEHGHLATHVVNMPLSAAGIFIQADFESMDADGFTLDWTDIDATPRLCWALCLAGGDYAVGAFTQPATDITVSTSVNFRTAGLLLMSANDASNSASEADLSISFGMASTTGGNIAQGCIWGGDLDAADPMQADSDCDDAAVIKMIAPGTTTVTGEATFAAPTGSAFRLAWTGVDGTQRLGTYLAFGPGIAGGGGGGGGGSGGGGGGGGNGGGNNGGGGGGGPGGGGGGGGPPGLTRRTIVGQRRLRRRGLIQIF